MAKKTNEKTERTEKKRAGAAATAKAGGKKPVVDLAKVRKDISKLVGSQAAEVTQAVLEQCKTGQLAPVKYLFEVSGLFPAGEKDASEPENETLAQTLMRKLNVPESPIESEDGEEDNSGMSSTIPAERAKKASAARADSGTATEHSNDGTV